MADSPAPIEQVARAVRLAYELGDLDLLGALLAPDVTWGPPGESFTCRNKSQVLAWYQSGANSGARAEIQEIEIVGDRLLVGLSVTGTSAATERGGRRSRWQVLTVKDSWIVDIVGFETRSDATAWVSR